MADIADKLRKAREFRREILGVKLTLIRPTRIQWIERAESGASFFDLAAQFVVGWEDVKEADLLVSGSNNLVPFDAAIWREYLADRIEFVEPVAEAVIESYNAYVKSLEDREKK